MKIVDIAICVNNIDPKGMGRIRCIRYNDYVGEKEKAMSYEEWDDKDPFIASPFLPTNLNLIPEIGQAVKVLNFNTEKETVNQEYIAGPFTTMYDFNSQTFSQQIENTTYGVAVKHKPDIRNKNGEYINKKSVGSFAKESDYGLYGKYGSDIIFTENGLILRGGKLTTKENATPKKREQMISYPMMSKNSAKIQLKKFPEKLTSKKEPGKKEVTESKDLNHVVEYEIVGLNGTQNINFYVYKIVKTFGQTYKTNFFSENSPLIVSTYKLINLDNSNSTPTFIVSGVSIDDVQKEIRDKIHTLHDESLNSINSLYPKDDLHPFYFRPSELFKNLTASNSTEQQNKTNILNKVRVSTVGPSSGLVWSISRFTPPVKPVDIIKDIFNQEPKEQTFGSITSDKVYMLSTDTNISEDKKISFDDLDKYEYSQEDYIKKIEPNTYATVRGENLLRVLYSIINVIFTHKHNINKPINEQTTYEDGIALEKLLKTLENDILNKSIRIN